MASVITKLRKNFEKARQINEEGTTYGPRKINGKPVSQITRHAKPATSEIVPLNGNTPGAATVTTVTPTPTPPKFFPFTPDFPTWEGDAAFTSSDYILLNRPDNKDNNTDPLKDPSKPIVFLTPRVIKRVQYVVEKAATKTGECSWMFLGRQLQNKSRHFLMYDMFLAEQDATTAHVDLDLEDVARYTEYLKENWPEQFPDGVAAQAHHGHSHGNLGVFWSSTDKKQQEDKTELGYQNDFRIFLVFNAAKQIYASMVVYYPVFFRIDDIPVGIYTGPGVQPCSDLTRADKKLLDEQIEELIKKPAPVTHFGNRWPAWRGNNNHRRHVPAWENEYYGLDYGVEYGMDRDDGKWPYPAARTPQDRQRYIDLEKRVYGHPGTVKESNQETNSDKDADYEGLNYEAATYTANFCKEAFATTQHATRQLPNNIIQARLDELEGAMQQSEMLEDTDMEQLAALRGSLEEQGFFDFYDFKDFLADFTMAFYADWENRYEADSGEQIAAPPLVDVLPLVLDLVLVYIGELASFMDTIFWSRLEVEYSETNQMPEALIPEEHMEFWDFLVEDTESIGMSCYTVVP